MRISDWSSDVCSSDLHAVALEEARADPPGRPHFLRKTAAPFDAHLDVGCGQLAEPQFGHDREIGDDRPTEPERDRRRHRPVGGCQRSEEHTSELQSLMRISYAVFCLKKKKHLTTDTY